MLALIIDPELLPISQNQTTLPALQMGQATTDPTTGVLAAPLQVQLIDKGDVNVGVIDAQGAQNVTTGGAKYQNVASAASQSVKTTPGRCCKVIVLVTGTGIATVYDNTAGSGQQILIIPASAPAATIYDIQVETTIGIFAVSAASGPQLLVTFN